MKNLERLILFLFLSSPYMTMAQKIYQAEGESEVRVEYNMTKEQTKERAIDLAIINAIESQFGTYVGQESTTIISDGRVDFNIIGTTRVRGEWVRTKDIKINEETRTIQGRNGKEQEIWLLCQITGEVRECVSRANIDFSTLSCDLLQCYRTVFKNNEDLFLYFKSPVDGYLSVFLDDGENTFRLLPYKSMGILNAVNIKGDNDYLFFSTDIMHQYYPPYKADRLTLYTDKEIEYNDFYIVFAESSYRKPILAEIKENEDRYIVPKSLKSDEFQEWLADCRADMPDFQAIRVRLRIEKY